MDNITLNFQDKALEMIADLAIKRKTGARGLRSIIERIMIDVMFDASNELKSIEIDESYVNNKFKA